jgi:glycosidase
MVCEAPNDPIGFASVAGSAFAFGLNRHLVAAAAGDAGALPAVLDYWQTMPAGMAVMLANHDIFAGDRVHDQLRGNPPRQRLAAASLLLGPGVPFIYYGEEIGMAGDPAQTADEGLRTPMSWTADGSGFSPVRPFRPLSPNAGTHNVAALEQAADSLLCFYRRLIALRRARPSLARGGIDSTFVEGLVLGFQRVWGGERTLVLLNYGGHDASIHPRHLPWGTALLPLEPGGPQSAAEFGAALWLPPHAVRVFAVQAGAAG